MTTTPHPTGRVRRYTTGLLAALIVVMTAFADTPADAHQQPVAVPTFPGDCILVSIFSDCAKGIPGFDDLDELLSGIGGFVGNQIREAGEGIVNWMAVTTLRAVVDLVGEVGHFLDTSTHADVTADAFFGPDGTYRKVATISALLLVAFMLCGIIQGLWSGEPGQAMWRIVRDTPIAVVAIVGIPLIVDHVLRIVDGLSTWILPPGQTSERIAAVFTHALASPVLGALPLLILALLAFFGTIAIYMELVIRASLVYVAVACAPLSFSTMAFPAARPAARKAVELLAAIILSKLMIAIALSTGLDLTDAWVSRGVLSGEGWGYFITGTAILVLACLSPFVLIKLMPIVETAVIAQGLSRAPIRSATQVAQQGYYLRNMMATNQTGGPMPATVPTPRPPGQTAGAGAGAGAGGTSTGAGAGAAAGGGAAAGAAAVAVPVAVGKAAADQVTTRAGRATASTAAAPPRPAGPEGRVPGGTS